VTIFFTGLSGSGKSTIANVLLTKFLETGGRPVTLLDGDLVRKHLSSELGFSKEHRDINIAHRLCGLGNHQERWDRHLRAHCALRRHTQTCPADDRALRRLRSGAHRTSVEVCEQRDRKGLYAKARAGILKEFTGISDPYEAPADADVVINTGELSAEEAAQEIILHLEREGFIGTAASRLRPVASETMQRLKPVRPWICY